MSHKMNLAFALAAGLFGGLLSHYVWPQPVQAQSQAPAPKEIRAQSVVLVNDKGTVLGTFAYDEGSPQGAGIPLSLAGPSIRLFDTSGREIWRAGGNAMRPLAAR